MGRNALLTVALTALVVLAGCAGAGSPAADAPGRNGGGETIQVGASGQVRAEPDQARLEVTVTAAGDDAASARRRLAENVSRLRGALAELGIPDDRIATVHYDIDRRHRRVERERDRERPEPRYEARHAFEITLPAVDRVGEVIDTAVTSGATGVDDIEFTLSEEKRRELRREALAEATGNARRKAEVLAAGSNLTVEGVHAVSTSRVDIHPVRETAALAAGGDGATAVESGPVTVTARVGVVYNATPG